jgi:glycosyl transferase, family 25
MYSNKILFLIILVLLVIIDYILLTNQEFFTNNNIFNKFDKIFYINLNHREDRKKQILNQLSKMDIPINKIYRIDAVHEKYNGHIGCAKSHIKTLEYAKKNNYKTVAVFEDDFVFTESKEIVFKRINDFLNNFDGKWDVIQLTAVYKKLTDIKYEDIKKVERASTSSAYIINSRFYDKLINILKESVKKMEEEMVEFNKKNNFVLKKKYQTKYALDQYWSKLQKNSDWYIFYPYLGKQGGTAGKSSIMGKNLEGFNSNTIRLFNLNV